MSRTPLPFPLSCLTTRDRCDVLTGGNTCEQALWGEAIPAAHIRNHKKKQRVLVVGDSLLRGTHLLA